MITILITVLIGVIIGIRNADVFSKIEAALWGGLFGVMAGFFLCMTITWLAPDKVYVEKYELALLSDDSKLTGRFFLGSGNIDSKMVFNFYLNHGGVYRLYTAPVNSSSIVYSSEKPCLKILTTKPDKEHWLWWFSLSGLLKGEDEYVFYVPPGSVKNQYDLDAW